MGSPELSGKKTPAAERKGVRASHVVYLSLVIALETALGFVFLGKYGFAVPAVYLGYLIYAVRGFRSLGGMSGDVSGYALTFGELCGVAVYALI